MKIIGDSKDVLQKIETLLGDFGTSLADIAKKCAEGRYLNLDVNIVRVYDGIVFVNDLPAATLIYEGTDGRYYTAARSDRIVTNMNDCVEGANVIQVDDAILAEYGKLGYIPRFWTTSHYQLDGNSQRTSLSTSAYIACGTPCEFMEVYDDVEVFDDYFHRVSRKTHDHLGNYVVCVGHTSNT